MNVDTSQTGTLATRLQQKSPITVESLDIHLIMYSTTHQKYASNMANDDILTHPEDFLGPNYKAVLNFWMFLDSLSVEQWKEVEKRDGDMEVHIVENASEDAAESVRKMFPIFLTGQNSRFDLFYGSNNGAPDTTWDATLELIGMNNLLEEGKSLTFVPLFSDL